MTGDWSFTLRSCDRRECEAVATWESWTRFTYSAHCDDHRPDAEGLRAQRHCPEGVLKTGAIYAHLEAPDA